MKGLCEKRQVFPKLEIFTLEESFIFRQEESDDLAERQARVDFLEGGLGANEEAKAVGGMVAGKPEGRVLYHAKGRVAEHRHHHVPLFLRKPCSPLDELACEVTGQLKELIDAVIHDLSPALVVSQGQGSKRINAQNLIMVKRPD